MKNLIQNGSPVQDTSGRRPENLAYIFQEVLTAIVRLKNGRQAATDEKAFRSQMKGALQTAAEEAARSGYSTQVIERAVFAAVAFVDECVLRNQSFSEWVSKPLQEELFKVHMGGQLFFEDVQRWLARQDSREVADLLEVYQLCILLGFRGQYGIGGQGELHARVKAISEKIRRVRGPAGDLSPAWQVPQEDIPRARKDPWAGRLLVAFGIFAAVALLLFVVFSLDLKFEPASLSPARSDGR
jgi:type VI secretion system protein ImpK